MTEVQHCQPCRVISIGFRNKIIDGWKDILFRNGFRDDHINFRGKDIKVFNIGKVLVVSVINSTGLMGSSATIDYLQEMAEVLVKMVTLNLVIDAKPGYFKINCPELGEKQSVVIGQNTNTSCRFFLRIDALLQVTI